MSDLVKLSEAIKVIPGNPTRDTVYRWINHGAGGRKLKTVMRGGRIFVSLAAIYEFMGLDAEGNETAAACN